MLPPRPSRFHHTPAPSAAASGRRLSTADIHLFSSPDGVIVGESPSEVYEPIKQAFNLPVYAQELALLLASRLYELYDPTGYMGLFS